MRRAMVLSFVAALAGCAHNRLPRGGETITYALSGSGICLACASYTVTLGPDGQGIFVGGRNTAAQGEHRFQATPDQVRRFAAQLQPYRPSVEVLMDRTPPCKQLSTDQDSVDVRWQPALASAAHLSFYAGCDYERNGKMAAALFAAPDALPISDLIGKH